MSNQRHPMRSDRLTDGQLAALGYVPASDFEVFIRPLASHPGATLYVLCRREGGDDARPCRVVAGGVVLDGR